MNKIYSIGTYEEVRWGWFSSRQKAERAIDHLIAIKNYSVISEINTNLLTEKEYINKIYDRLISDHDLNVIYDDAWGKMDKIKDMNERVEYNFKNFLY